MDTPKKNRLDHLRNKFLQMTSPHEFGQERKKNVTIISRNVPPMLARADAAFVTVSDALQQKNPDSDRSAFYNTLFLIIDEAVIQATDADQLTRADGIRADLSSLIESLQFLQRNLCILCATADAAGDSGDPDGFYHCLEMQTRDFLLAGLNKLVPTYNNDRKIFLKSLTKADIDRFAHAKTAFSDQYKNQIDGTES